MKLKSFAKKSHLKPWDVIIIALLILSSFIPAVIFAIDRQDVTKTPEKQAVLRVDGEELKTFDLSSDKSYTYRYEDPDGDYNLIEVADGRIRIKEANCGDQICVRRGWAAKDGETIVCLPHKLVIEIQDNQDKGGDSDDLIY